MQEIRLIRQSDQDLGMFWLLLNVPIPD